MEARQDMRTKTKARPLVPPATNLEEVKRRFIRQNRELAKCNSSQSLRIRMLESDVLRLSQDNLELREQTIVLENELRLARIATASSGIAKWKEDLQTKLAELSAIVGEVDYEAVPAIEDRPNILKSRPWPMEAQARERQSLAALMQEVQMPTIEEDKAYPRMTLDPDQIHQLRLSGGSAQSNESPEIGPPPIARLDCGDTTHIKFEAPEEDVPYASPAKKLDWTKEYTTEQDPATELSINFETRRKRKDAPARAERRRSSILPASPIRRQEELPSTLRTGAKRKLADRETEKPIKPPSQDDFTFSRKVSETRIKSPDEPPTREASPSPRPSTPPIKTQQPAEAILPEPSVDSSLQRPASPIKLQRKVLGEKDVNISPKKAPGKDKSSKGDQKKAAAPRAPSTREKPKSRRTTISSIPLPSPKQESCPEFSAIHNSPSGPTPTKASRPKTPSGVRDFSSVPISEPSFNKSVDIHNDAPSLTDLAGGGRRATRRRSEVNYAEPSLVTKMRRSDKRSTDSINCP